MNNLLNYKDLNYFKFIKIQNLLFFINIFMVNNNNIN